MNGWDESTARLNHDDVGDPDAPFWVVVAILVLLLPVFLLWAVAQGVGNTLGRQWR